MEANGEHAVAAWWREQFNANGGVRDQPEEHLSNWFLISDLPANIYFHILYDSRSDKPRVKTELPHPAFQHKSYIVAFTQADDFEDQLGESIRIGDTHTFLTADFLGGRVREDIITRKEARDFITRLLRLAWEKMVQSRTYRSTSWRMKPVVSISKRAWLNMTPFLSGI
jgi:hypothetical protein